MLAQIVILYFFLCRLLVVSKVLKWLPLVLLLYLMCIHFNGIKYHTFLLVQRVCLRNWNSMMMLNELVMSHIVSLLWHTGSYSGFVIDFDFKLWIHITSKSLIRIPLWKLLFDTLCRDYGMTVSSYERYIYMSKKIKFLLWHCQYHWRHYIL